MTDWIHEGMTCPHCSKRLDRSTDGGKGRPPGDGDASFCLQCGGVSVYTKGGTALRLPTDGELQEFEADPHFNQQRLKLMFHIAARKGRS